MGIMQIAKGNRIKSFYGGYTRLKPLIRQYTPKNYRELYGTISAKRVYRPSKQQHKGHFLDENFDMITVCIQTRA